ncbi:MAG: septum formation protein Maf [Chitinophagaceae bacterium]|nr:septum formation protein Maf [Chitinophagaceae bacterium]
MKSIILASQSPRRKQLLEWAEIKFSIVVANTKEQIPTDIPLTEVPIFIAREKAQVVQEKTNKASIIIAADTIVILENEILGKPKDRVEAINFLTKLSNKTHQVITGVVLLKSDKEIAFAETTLVEFHGLTLEQIEFYVDEYRPYDKAGAYAIQEWIGVVGIKKVVGDFYNVMGLPISRVVQELDKF